MTAGVSWTDTPRADTQPLVAKYTFASAREG